MYAEQRNNTKKWDAKTHLVLNLELVNLIYCVQSSELHYGLNLAWSYTHKVQTWGVIPWQRYKMGTLSLSGPWSRHRSFFREFFSWNRTKMKFDNQNSMKTGGWSVCRHVTKVITREHWEWKELKAHLTKKETRFHSTINSNMTTMKVPKRAPNTSLMFFKVSSIQTVPTQAIWSFMVKCRIQKDWLEFQWCYLEFKLLTVNLLSGFIIEAKFYDFEDYTKKIVLAILTAWLQPHRTPDTHSTLHPLFLCVKVPTAPRWSGPWKAM